MLIRILQYFDTFDLIRKKAKAFLIFWEGKSSYGFPIFAWGAVWKFVWAGNQHDFDMKKFFLMGYCKMS